MLTPVHIGSGDTLSPLEYVLRQHEDAWRLYRLDMRAWFAEYGQDSAVRSAVESTDLKRIQRVVNEKTGPRAEDAERFALFSCRIPDASLAEETLQNALDRQSGKKGEVSAILRNPADGSVCLPGSSLKLFICLSLSLSVFFFKFCSKASVRSTPVWLAMQSKTHRISAIS